MISIANKTKSDMLDICSLWVCPCDTVLKSISILALISYLGVTDVARTVSISLTLKLACVAWNDKDGILLVGC